MMVIIKIARCMIFVIALAHFIHHPIVGMERAKYPSLPVSSSGRVEHDRFSKTSSPNKVTPNEKWSQLKAGSETRGFRYEMKVFLIDGEFEKEGTLYYRGKKFPGNIENTLSITDKLTLHETPSIISISPADPTGRYVFFYGGIGRELEKGRFFYGSESPNLFLADVMDMEFRKVPLPRHGVENWIAWSQNGKYAVLFEEDHELPWLYVIDLNKCNLHIIDMDRSILTRGNGEKIQYDMESFSWKSKNQLQGTAHITCSKYETPDCDYSDVKRSYRVIIDLGSEGIKHSYEWMPN